MWRIRHRWPRSGAVPVGYGEAMRIPARHLLAGILLAALALAGCAIGPNADRDDEADSASLVEVGDATLVAGDVDDAAAYAVLRNTGDRDVVVVSASYAGKGSLELHQATEGDNGRLVSRRLEGGLTIPAGSVVRLLPGGDHLRFLGLSEPFEVGQELDITLTFNDKSSLEFTAVGQEADEVGEPPDATEQESGDD